MKRRETNEFDLIKIFIGIIIALVLIIIIGFAVMKKIGDKKAQEAYDQAIEESSDHQIVEVAPNAVVEMDVLQELVKPASDLVTYKYYYTDAGVYEKDKKIFGDTVTVPFTTDKVIYTYSGTISVGVDVSDTKFVIDRDNKKITVYIPEPKIMYHELDKNSMQSYSAKDSIFTETSLEEYGGLVDKLKETQETKLANNREFWDNAKNNTRSVISSLLTAGDQLDDYTISYEWRKSAD